MNESSRSGPRRGSHVVTIDIYNAAKLILDHRREDADTYAAERANALLKQGDLDGSLIWRRVLVAVIELQRGSGDGEGDLMIQDTVRSG